MRTAHQRRSREVLHGDGGGGEQARMDFTTVKKTHKSIRLSR